MLASTSAAISGALLVLLRGPAAALAPSSAPNLAPASAFDLNPPPSYTFHMDVVMAMRHFPWLHFHMEGVGDYQPGDRYVVHFTTLPWFAPRKQHDVDLSMLDPAMWPKHYTYRQTGWDRGDAVFALHSLDDPTLKSATVALAANGDPHWFDTTYSDGLHVHMMLGCGSVDGFELPTTLTGDVDMPHMPLSANADFTDYDFASQPQPND